MTSTAPPPSDAALQAGEAPTPIVVPWTPRDVFVGFIIWAGSVVALFGVGLFVPARLADPATLAIFAVGEAALLIPVFFLAIRKHKARGQDLGLRGFAWKLPAIGCAGMLIIYGCNYFYALILSAFSLRVQPSLTPLMTGTAHPIVLLVLGVFLAPPAEEVFFRGFVFAGLRRSMGWRKAALVSSALFALSHLTLTAILPIFAIGWLYAFLYERGRSIWPSTLLHMLTNAIGLTVTYAFAGHGGVAIVP